MAKKLKTNNMDICKCSGLGCPHKENCYRFTAPASEWQSYFLNPPIKDGKCDMYWGENVKGIWEKLNEITKP
jgi:hypothetical protein